MNIHLNTRNKVVLLLAAIAIMTLASTRLRADTSTCSGQMVTVPFTDVAGSIFFCTIAEAFFSGLTNGTDATHYSPSANVTRDQMSAFITRTQDSALRRGSKRAALGQFWTTNPQYSFFSVHGDLEGYGVTDVGSTPFLAQSDGEDVWVANFSSSTISQVHASTGKVIGTWTNATSPVGVVVGAGRVFAIGDTNPLSLYMIDPRQTPGAVTVVSNALGGGPCESIAFDGSRIWAANKNTLSIITPTATTTWLVTNVTTGFSGIFGIIFDGSSMWVTDSAANTLLKLDQNGAILQTVNVGNDPTVPVFDGTNIWVPNFNDQTVTVVRAATGAVLATLSGNGLAGPLQAAFDGQRILVTNLQGDSVSLWKAADLTPIGNFSTGPNSGPYGACNDGVNFWITLNGKGRLARF
jgi:hypothetical protein